MFNRIKNGFTLAEVLITLVIIGVVAALTIPTAINKYKDEELKSQFKKAYSTISQAINKTELNDFFGYAECYYSVNPATGYYSVLECSKCGIFYNTLAKNLSVQKSCPNNSLSGGCIPVYASYGTPDVGCGGYTEDSINNNSRSYVLADGQIIIVYQGAGTTVPYFLIDINGMKGPNAYGKDLFSFFIGKDLSQNIIFKGAECGFTPVSGGRTTNEMIKYALSGKK